MVESSQEHEEDGWTSEIQSKIKIRLHQIKDEKRSNKKDSSIMMHQMQKISHKLHESYLIVLNQNLDIQSYQGLIDLNQALNGWIKSKKTIVHRLMLWFKSMIGQNISL